jgi:HPt (histidine-containing phosphotransfer) domain-containing protein
MARWTESQRETFEALRRAYLADVPERIAAIRQAAAALRGGAPQRALDELRHLVHRLVGSSAIFGLPRLAAAGRELEDRVIASIEGAEGVGGLDELAAALETTWKEIAAARSGEPGG